MSIPIPQGPTWSVDWKALEGECPWLAGLASCPQDALHHGEGDVGTHTRMVVEALASLPAWRGLDPSAREAVFLSALFHDAGKPDCTRVERDGRITSRGHSRRGELIARAALYRAGVDPSLREEVAALVRFHQLPLFLLEGQDPRRRAFEASLTARCDRLALLAQADALGRLCSDQRELLEKVALFVEYCREQGCLEGPRAFPSPHSRFLYFRKPGRDPDYLAFDDSRCEVLLLSGLPGAGKDSWLRRARADWPVVSLDRLREELDLDPGEPQGKVAEAAREQAKAHLRAARSFAINATNVTRDVRGRWTDLAAAYGARIRVVHVEAPYRELLAGNRARPSPVPDRVIEGLIDRWEPADLTEAHEIERVGLAAPGGPAPRG